LIDLSESRISELAEVRIDEMKTARICLLVCLTALVSAIVARQQSKWLPVPPVRVEGEDIRACQLAWGVHAEVFKDKKLAIERYRIEIRRIGSDIHVGFISKASKPFKPQLPNHNRNYVVNVETWNVKREPVSV
jgi:hypothetical protein